MWLPNTSVQSAGVSAAGLRSRCPSRMIALVRWWLSPLAAPRSADHDHFGDHIEPQLAPTFAAHLFTRSLALAHLDARLRSDAAAQQLLSTDPAAVLRERGAPALSFQEMTVR